MDDLQKLEAIKEKVGPSPTAKPWYDFSGLGDEEMDLYHKLMVKYRAGDETALPELHRLAAKVRVIQPHEWPAVLQQAHVDLLALLERWPKVAPHIYGTVDAAVIDPEASDDSRAISAIMLL